MAGSTVKKAVLLRFDRENLSGFVNPQTYLQERGVELLSPSGNVSLVPYTELKAVCFVRDFQSGDPLEKRKFQVRPKLNGLWVRVAFRDGDSLEGMVANNLLWVEALGFSLLPPDYSGNTQKVWTPRAALQDAQVLGVVGSPLRKPAREKAAPKEQIRLFE